MGKRKREKRAAREALTAREACQCGADVDVKLVGLSPASHRRIEFALALWLGDRVYHVGDDDSLGGVVVGVRFDGAWLYQVAWCSAMCNWHYDRELTTERFASASLES